MEYLVAVSEMVCFLFSISEETPILITKLIATGSYDPKQQCSIEHNTKVGQLADRMYKKYDF